MQDGRRASGSPSIFHLPSSIFHLPSSIFHLPSSIFHLPSSIFYLLSGSPKASRRSLLGGLSLIDWFAAGFGAEVYGLADLLVRVEPLDGFFVVIGFRVSFAIDVVGFLGLVDQNLRFLHDAPRFHASPPEWKKGEHGYDHRNHPGRPTAQQDCERGEHDRDFGDQLRLFVAFGRLRSE